MAELDIFMQKYIHLVSTRCDCDKNVLTTLYEELLNEQQDAVKKTCSYKFLRGCNKDTLCGDVVFENKLCKKHAKQQATKDKIQGKKTQSVKTEMKPKKIEEIELKPIVVHFDSKLNENMMHTNKSPIEITKEYEKIIPKITVVSTHNQNNKIVKRRILPPSLRPTLKIGDKVSYNDGKKTCNGIIKKIIKDMAELDNITNASNNDNKLFIGPMRYMLLQSGNVTKK